MVDDQFNYEGLWRRNSECNWLVKTWLNEWILLLNGQRVGLIDELVNNFGVVDEQLNSKLVKRPIGWFNWWINQQFLMVEDELNNEGLWISELNSNEFGYLTADELIDKDAVTNQFTEESCHWLKRIKELGGGPRRGNRMNNQRKDEELKRIGRRRRRRSCGTKRLTEITG